MAVTVRLNSAKKKGFVWISWALENRAMWKERTGLISHPEGKDRYQATKKSG